MVALRKKILRSIFFFSLFGLLFRPARCQTTSDVNEKYLFYLHGAIVQDMGIHAVSKDFGPYKYLDIVDTLKSRGFIVISEARPKDTRAEDYAQKITSQIDSLIAAKIPFENILLVGASAGAGIVMEIALRKKESKLHYVIMGLCWPDTKEQFEGKALCGNFLSIYEKSDPHGSCKGVFEGKSCPVFKEIQLNMGNSHGFIYQPFREWIDPIIGWFDKK
jgi:hypothetical protein